MYIKSEVGNSLLVSKDEFEVFVEISKLIEKQIDYAVTFSIISLKLYSYDHIAKIK